MNTTLPLFVGRRALELRVGRAIVRSGQIIARVRPHSSISIRPIGQYAVLSYHDRSIVEFVDLEPFARRLGVIREGEQAEVRTAADMHTLGARAIA